MIGTTIAHYRVLERIGGGGMGVVYKAEDLRLGRFVALKFLPDEYADDPSVLERFRREARAVSALNHPNICTLHDIVEAAPSAVREPQGGPEPDRGAAGSGRAVSFLVMELLEGRNLREIILERGALPLAQLLRVAADVAEGLAAAHDKGILHRDLKPANIVVTDRGPAKILDFGLAKMDARAASAGTGGGGAADLASRTGGWAMGTVAYMSPEQALGKPLDQRSDLFSLGAVLYEMATGVLPFNGDTTGVLFLSIVQGTPLAPRTLNPELPEPLQHIIGKCLEKDRERRYQSAADLLDDLKRLQPAPAATSPETRGERPRKRFRAWVPWVAAASLALLAAAAGLLFAVRGRSAALTDKDPIVIAAFANTTGDPVFDGSLKQALSIQLGQSPFLNIVADSRIASTLKLMNRAPGERLTRPLAREVCQRTNSKAYLTGSIGKDRGTYSVELQAFTCADDRLLATSAGAADSREKVLEALDEAGSGMRRKLGESLPSLKGFGRPLADVTTSSLEALKAYSDGQAVSLAQGYQAALPYFTRAVQLDPNFASAYVRLGTLYWNLKQRDLASENYRRAYELRNRVTERERYLIESREHVASGDLTRDIETCLQWVAAYPNDVQGHSHLGLDYLLLGQNENAARHLREALALAPDNAAARVNLSSAYRRSGRLDEARRVLDSPAARRIDNEAFRVQRYMLAFLDGDRAAMQEQLKQAEGRPGYEDNLLLQAACIEEYHGRFAKARELHARARTSAEKAGGAGRAAGYLADQAMDEGHVGNFAMARQLATRGLTGPNARNVLQRNALALAVAGDTAAAVKRLQELTANPRDVLVQNFAVPTIRAYVEMNNGHPAKAIEILHAALPFDLAVAEFSSLQPAYARGLAYLQLRRGPDAAREFQKLIDNPGAVYDSVLGALARLQRARARVLIGDLDAARTDYQDFLALWKDADPDVPILNEARAEYEKLK